MSLQLSLKVLEYVNVFSALTKQFAREKLLRSHIYFCWKIFQWNKICSTSRQLVDGIEIKRTNLQIGGNCSYEAICQLHWVYSPQQRDLSPTCSIPELASLFLLTVFKFSSTFITRLRVKKYFEFDLGFKWQQSSPRNVR